MILAQTAPNAAPSYAMGVIFIVIVVVAAIVLVAVLRRMLGRVHKPRSFTAVTEVELPGADLGEIWRAVTDVEHEDSRPDGASFRWLDADRTLYRYEDSGGQGITWMVIEEKAPTRSVRQYELDAMSMRGIIEIDMARAGGGVAMTVTHHCDVPGVISMMLKRRPNAEHSMAADLVNDLVKRAGLTQTPEIRPVDIAESPEPLVEPLDIDADPPELQAQIGPRGV